ncbi:MAG: DNRLRE domain-containing protein [Bacteroidales bacterium]
MLTFLVFDVKSQTEGGGIPKSSNDTLVITAISKELYICTCKPNTANPNGEGKIYYQGRFKEDKVTDDADYHNCDERFLMQWDLSVLPKGIKIIEAKMQLVCAGYTGDKQGQLAYECIVEPWDTNIGYGKKPNTSSETRILTDWPVKNTYHFVDITSFVQLWYSGNIQNHGLMGFSINTETTNSALFCSSKFPKENLRPKLTIIYSRE